MNKSIFDFLELGVIVSGGDPKGKGSNKGDHPYDKSYNQKVMLPGIHDPKNVKQEHLAFSPMMVSPTAFSQMTSQGTLDPGTLVYVLKMPGQTGGIILGQANETVNYDKGGQGGQNLLGAEYFQNLFNRETGVNIPPDIKETEEDGVKVKAIKEKGKKHKHSLLKGLPSHNAIQATTGYKLEQLKNIPTAKQAFDALPTNDIMGMLPGNIMSLGQIFQGLMGNTGGSGSANGAAPPTSSTPINRIKKKIDPPIFDAMMSMSQLVQGDGGSDASAFCTSNRVHTETYLQNAEDLLSQVTTLEDLFIVMHRLQYDQELFGLDKLANNVVEIETAWGNANLVISVTGDIDLNYANSNVIYDFTQAASNPSASPSASGGGGGGGNMFGRSAETITKMMQRLGPNNQKESKKMHQTLNQSSLQQSLWRFVESTTKGGNPLDPSHFKNIVG